MPGGSRRGLAGISGVWGVRPGLSCPPLTVPSPLAKPAGESTPRLSVQAQGTCAPHPRSSHPVDGTPGSRGPSLGSSPPVPAVCRLGCGVWGSRGRGSLGGIPGGLYGGFRGEVCGKRCGTEQKRARRSRRGWREKATGGKAPAAWRLPVVPRPPRGSRRAPPPLLVPK